MNDNCENFEGLLVSLADNELKPAEKLKVQQHLENCEDCRMLLKALDDSLITAEAVWADNLQANHKDKRHHLYYVIKAAACLIVITGLFFGYNGIVADKSDKDITRLETPALTMAEIEYQIEMEAIAARLLAKTELIKQHPDRVPNVQEYIQNEYRHIVKMYPETLTAKQVAQLIR